MTHNLLEQISGCIRSTKQLITLRSAGFLDESGEFPSTYADLIYDVLEKDTSISSVPYLSIAEEPTNWRIMRYIL